MAETNFFWDPLSDNMLQERDETGAVAVGYSTEVGLYGDLISQNRGGVESQYHFDAIGSTLALTEDNQQVSDNYAYTGFGEITAQSGAAVTPFKYLGQLGALSDPMGTTVYYSRSNYRPAAGRLFAMRLIHGQGWSYAVDAFGTNWMIVALAQVSAANAEDPLCTPDEKRCIRDAIELVKDAIATKRGVCFGDIARCPNGQRSACTPDVIGDCILSVLEKTTYLCAKRGIGGCHMIRDPRDRNVAHTDSLCALIKGAGARGVKVPGLKDCEPCKFPLSYANDCAACPDSILFVTATFLCRDVSPDRRSIESYCNSGNPDDIRRLAVTLVHEAAHSCVGGHDTTGKAKADDAPSCDVCNRNDSFDIDAGFKKCLA